MKPSHSPQVVQRPNVLLVFSDQHRWCDVGCYGSNNVGTPHLDRLAAEGVRFESCLSNSPLCVPARAALLTGLHAMRHKALGNDLPVAARVESVADVFARAGYRTGYFGKWHLGGIPRDKAIPADQRLGFAEWKAVNCPRGHFNGGYHDENGVFHPTQGYDPAIFTGLVIEAIARAGSQPWFFALSWNPPHDPFFPAVDSRLRDPREIKLRGNVPPVIRDKAKREIARDDWRGALAGYYSHIAALDDEMGRLLAALDQAGCLERTLIIYTSDHGDMLGSHGRQNKQLPYEEAVRVPLIISGPGVLRGHVTNEMIGLVDIPVTLAGLAGLPFRGATDGRNLSALARNPKASGLDHCYLYELTACHQAEDWGIMPWRAVRTRTHTYAESWNGSPMLLSDNADDPLQMRNTATEESAGDLRALLHELVAKHDGPWGREDILRRAGLLGAWNESQQYFGRPGVSQQHP